MALNHRTKRPVGRQLATPRGVPKPRGRPAAWRCLTSVMNQPTLPLWSRTR